MKFGRDVQSIQRKGTGGGGQGCRQNIKISKNWGVFGVFNALRDNITSILFKKKTFFLEIVGGMCPPYQPLVTGWKGGTTF